MFRRGCAFGGCSLFSTATFSTLSPARALVSRSRSGGAGSEGAEDRSGYKYGNQKQYKRREYKLLPRSRDQGRDIRRIVGVPVPSIVIMCGVRSMHVMCRVPGGRDVTLRPLVGRRIVR